MSIAADQHKATFQMRDDLADWLQEGFVVDDRVKFREGDDPGGFYSDLAEALIREGWVEQAPRSQGTDA